MSESTSGGEVVSVRSEGLGERKHAGRSLAGQKEVGM